MSPMGCGDSMVGDCHVVERTTAFECAFQSTALHESASSGANCIRPSQACMARLPQQYRLSRSPRFAALQNCAHRDARRVHDGMAVQRAHTRRHARAAAGESFANAVNGSALPAWLRITKCARRRCQLRRTAAVARKQFANPSATDQYDERSPE
jgi:hypothetical protein